MKRIFFLLIAVLFFLSAGCSKSEYTEYGPKYETVNNLDGVTLIITELHDTYAVIAFQNDSSNQTVAYCNHYIEKLVDGAWTYIPTREPFPSCAVEVLPGERSDDVHPHPETVYFNYEDKTESLSPGTYRIIKPVQFLITLEDGTRKASDWHYLAAEFTIE